MDEQQMRRVLEWFRTHVGPITCSVCSHTEFKFDSELTSLPIWRSDKTPRVDFSEDLAAVILTCSHCASIRLFSAVKMGLIPESILRSEHANLFSGRRGRGEAGAVRLGGHGAPVREESTVNRTKPILLNPLGRVEASSASASK